MKLELKSLEVFNVMNEKIGIVYGESAKENWSDLSEKDLTLLHAITYGLNVLLANKEKGVLMEENCAIALAKKLFAAYNETGPNPWKTWDGKDVPKWDELNDQVRWKWEAVADKAFDLVEGGDF